MNHQTEARRNLEVMFQRQMLFYQQVQDIIFDDAQKKAQEFYAIQKKLSQQVHKDNQNKDWSDLSIAVRKTINGSVTVHWRIRIWYKSTNNSRKNFNARHISKARNSQNYKKSLAKHAIAEEYETVMKLEDQFERLRKFSKTVQDARRQMLKTSKELGFSMKDEPFIIGQESAYALHEQIGNLMLLLRHKIWPTQTDADRQADFVPLIDPHAGLPRDVDTRELNTSLQKLEEAHVVLGNLLII
ncbi:hypothetical protein HF670_06200 [Acidithiobacillus thiooxidans]|jgi:hypothetical protein|uniref:Uncharacterized protein n=1 Tax=Acidithiobacillus marinus TaxID=187490 RepID=A0A2I1DLI2_9PROT|nr:MULTISPECIES: conjugative transfer protein MobI(A/C) [Acidithiobacillus]MBU2839162.1 hypothetical protein [Acidithiobacillus thiooxidans]PKY10728.1 hypothetical protein B1757_09160 [Acidithiobacillus marinus]